MHDSSLNQIGRNMIIVVLIILLSYIFTMDSVKHINNQLLFILLVFVALIIYKMINYNAYVKYTNDKINELKQIETFNNNKTNNSKISQKIITELEEIFQQYNNIDTKPQSNSTNYNLNSVNIY